MKRSFIVVLAFAAFAVAADKWDPKTFAPHKHAVGEKFMKEGTVERANKMTADGQALPGQNEHSSATYKILHEVVAMEGEQVTEEKLSVEEFALKDLDAKDAKEDTSLKGVHAHWKLEKNGRPKIDIEGEKEHPVTGAARRWLQSVVGNKDAEKDKKLDAAILPKEPVAAGAEWDGDAKAVCAAIMKGAECDASKSKVHGKLVELSGTEGHLQVEIDLQLASMPTPGGPMPFTEGGLMKMHMEMQGHLEGQKHKEEHLTADFSGKASVKGQGGKNVVISFDTHEKKTEKTTPQ